MPQGHMEKVNPNYFPELDGRVHEDEIRQVLFGPFAIIGLRNEAS